MDWSFAAVTLLATMAFMITCSLTSAAGAKPIGIQLALLPQIFVYIGYWLAPTPAHHLQALFFFTSVTMVVPVLYVLRAWFITKLPQWFG